MQFRRWLARLGSTACLVAIAAGAQAASISGKTELRIEVRHSDGSQAILTRSLDENDERRLGVSAASDSRPDALGAPLPPQPPHDADYPPGVALLEFVQRRGVWVRTTRFTRNTDGNWQLSADTLDNPRDRNTLSKPLVGPIRPVQ